MSFTPPSLTPENTVKVQINGYTQVYAALVTTAPAVYDGFGTLSLAPAWTEGLAGRLVLVKPEHLAWQAGQYFSGMHGVRNASEAAGDDEITTARDVLIERLANGDE